jgi:hypothetical protein
MVPSHPPGREGEQGVIGIDDVEGVRFRQFPAVLPEQSQAAHEDQDALQIAAVFRDAQLYIFPKGRHILPVPQAVKHVAPHRPTLSLQGRNAFHHPRVPALMGEAGDHSRSGQRHSGKSGIIPRFPQNAMAWQVSGAWLDWL